MKNNTKILFLCCIIFFLQGKGIMNAQSSLVPPEYVFFHGDSLDGFDWKANLAAAAADHVNARELSTFLYRSEHTYVINKYHIVVNKKPLILLKDGSAPTTLTPTSACNNLDFADGNYTNWTGSVGVNNNSAAALTLTAAGITPYTLGINSKEYSCSWFTLVNTGTDPFGKFPMVAPGGVYSCRIGGEHANESKTNGNCGTTAMSPTGDGSMGEVIQQSYPVTKANALFTYEYAVVLCDGGHPTGEQPYFSASVVDAAGNNIPCLTYYQECSNGAPPTGYLTSDSTFDPSMSISCNNGVCDTTYTGGSPIYYLPWTVNSINLTNYIGTTITIKFTVAGCTVGGHFGYAYIDGACGIPLQLTIVHQCGSATITAPPGSAKYAWSGPGITGSSSSQTVTVDVTGTYSVTLTSSQGCSYTLDTLVTIPPPLSFTTTATPATCTTKGTGTVTNLSGGTTPYTYSWTPTGQTTSAATGLSIGTYSIVVSDNGGCTKTETVTITEPTTVIAYTVATTGVSCNGGNNGTATSSASGGTVPYTYVWTPTGGNTATGTSLSAGIYTVTVTDKNGCASTAAATITQPTLLVVNTTMTPTTCGNSNGTATATASGGSAPYKYSWAPTGGSNSTATGLAATTYTVTVKDANGCSATASTVITQPQAPGLTTSSTPASCNLSNGSATVNVTGGTTPYTYAWNPSGETTATATGIPIGTYTVTVTTNTGCTTTTTVTVTEPSAVNVTVTATTEVSCNGGSNGTITTNTTGGSAPYTYSWTPTGQATANATGLSAGTYTVTAIDKNGCISTTTAIITQPTPVVVTTSMTQTTCGSNNGSATATASGGTPGYNYSWAPAGSNTATINGISAGTYTCTVTDKNNCVGTSIIIVTSIGGAVVSITSSTNELCFGEKIGTATATVSGGATPYTYAWSPSGGNGPGATGLSAGTYNISVKDANGCTSAATVTITQPTAITSTTSFTPASCNLSNGSATVNAANGTPPYKYLWDPSGQTTATATGIPIGKYAVTITDNNGCTETNSVTVTEPSAVTAIISGTTPVSCNGGNNGTATATASGGLAPYTYSWTPIGGTNTTANGLSAGTYTVTATDNKGCISTTTAVITQPPLLTVTVPATTNVLCNGGTDGSATSAVTGGTMPYQYAWTPTGGSNATGTGLIAGNYTVTVTDAHGCVATVTTTITQPVALATTTSFTAAYCNLDNGSATVNVTNGTAPYTYLWTPSSEITPTATGIGIGTYTVNVTDNNGCTTSTSVTVTEPSAVVANITGNTPVSCFGGNNGTASADATGGTSPYSFLWEPGGNTNALATGLDAGIYTVIVTDASGCISSTSTIITQPPALSVSISGPLYLCSGASGTLIATPTGGTAPYSYAWSASSNDSTATISVTPPVATTYTVIVTDANGCKATNVFTVSIGSPLFLSTNGNASVCTNVPVTFCGYPSGGTGGNIFSWQPGNYTSPCITVTPSATTTYTVTVTDNCGASVTATSTVQINPSPQVNFYSDITEGCTNLCIQFYDNSTIQSGGIASYDWEFGDGATLSSESAIHCYPDTGMYTVILTVTSDSGCSTTLKRVRMIHALGHPTAAFSLSPQPTSMLDPTIQFTDQTTDPNGGITYWTWTYGDYLDSVGTTQNAVHTYQDTGTYCAKLVVMDHKGCTDTAVNCLVIDPFFTLYIPNAFTPNGDGLNEVFTAKGDYVKDFEMYIFDRWGEQLYHTTDINKGWNGTVKGGTTISQEDVYVYRILATDWQNHQYVYIGSVTLLK